MPDASDPKSPRLNGGTNSLQCPCCGSRLALGQSNGNGTAHLVAEDAGGLVPAAAGNIFIDPHAHMIARTTDDYIAMAQAGVAAGIQPAVLIGPPRTKLGFYLDYFSTII